MEERDAIFREQLVALMSALNGDEGKDAQLRANVAQFRKRLVTEAGATGWGDLKDRADGATYDAMLALFQRESARLAKAGDDKGVRAFEILAISLIARRQYDAEVLPGIAFLDRYIASCRMPQTRKGPVVIVRPLPN